MVPRNDGQLTPPINQQSDHIVLHTTIDSHNLDGIALTKNLDLFGTNLGDQVTHVGIRPICWYGSVQIYLDPADHGTLLANFLCQHSGVNVAQSRDALFLEPIAKGGCGVPVRVVMGVILYDESGGVDFVGFEIGGQSEFVELFAVGDTVVSYHWCGECDDLALIRRISQRLRITNHTSGENDLSSVTLVTTKTPSGQRRSILQMKLCQRSGSLGVIAALGGH
mmetsp:Transcript_32814/g.69011  ORF Transcript_32814/g.69011 Transcript_32814/m.69011 type:complete len:223 (-) Transcript_32814:188-856(-)